MSEFVKRCMRFFGLLLGARAKEFCGMSGGCTMSLGMELEIKTVSTVVDLVDELTEADKAMVSLVDLTHPHVYVVDECTKVCFSVVGLSTSVLPAAG